MDVGTYSFAALRWACTSFSRRLIFMRVSSDCLRPVALPCIAYRVPVWVSRASLHQSGIEGPQYLQYQLPARHVAFADTALGFRGPNCLPRLC
jgi:hypothetical protein